MGFEDSSLRWDVWVAEFSRHGAAILSHKHSKKLKYADTGQWKSRWMASRNIGEYHTVVRIPLTFCLDWWVVTDTINIDFTTSTYCRSATYSRITLERLKNAGAIDMVRVSPLSSLAFVPHHFCAAIWTPHLDCFLLFRNKACQRLNNYHEGCQSINYCPPNTASAIVHHFRSGMWATSAMLMIPTPTISSDFPTKARTTVTWTGYKM